MKVCDLHLQPRDRQKNKEQLQASFSAFKQQDNTLRAFRWNFSFSI